MIGSGCSTHGVKLVYYWKELPDKSKKLVKACPVCENLKLVEFVCSKCDYKNNYYTPGETIIKCLNCNNGSKILAKTITQKIPNWRLNIDDASEEEVLKASSKTFGMPLLDKEEWEAHYANEEYEKEKQTQFETEKKKLTNEVLGSESLLDSLDGKMSDQS